MTGVRRAAVAGLFYPAEREELAATVERYLEDAAREAPGSPVPVTALVVPHAGYVYSGPVAARAYAKLCALKGRVRRVVLIGPAHFVSVSGLAVPRAEVFECPLGAFPVDRAAIESVAHLPDVRVSDAPHAPEHSLEVQLPFLWACLGKVPLVPLVVGDAGPAAVSDVLARLWRDPETLLVVSTDLSHYQSYREARRRDTATAAAIEVLDHTSFGPEAACGYRGLAGAMVLARQRELAVHRLDLRNSGDTAGPRDRVVGYGAWALTERLA